MPERNWKFSAADVRGRRWWDEYQKAFSEMLSATGTEWALIEIDPRYPTMSKERKRDLLADGGEFRRGRVLAR